MGERWGAQNRESRSQFMILKFKLTDKPDAETLTHNIHALMRALEINVATVTWLDCVVVLIPHNLGVPISQFGRGLKGSQMNRLLAKPTEEERQYVLSKWEETKKNARVRKETIEADHTLN